MDITALWEKYTTEKDQQIREKLILHYIYLVKYIAGRLFVNYKNTVDYDDLVSYGIFGLIDAIDKYDLSRGVKFDTYAQIRIRGAIIDFLREADWIPRSVRQKAKEIELAYDEIESEKGESATDKEVAEKLGVSLEEFHKRINSISSYTLVSLDDYLEQSRETSFKSERLDDSPEKVIEREELKIIIAGFIDNLPEKEKSIITLYYFEELTYKEIGSILSISESRVSQLHTKAIIRLKKNLKLFL
ncbi:MAG: FliA/WhiG family RNA polymerase sigma factor [Firmicutes bacterium]|nr:FliA/WhiG family RNA polymerase sigma factor [Bacillota bacterium]